MGDVSLSPHAAILLYSRLPHRSVSTGAWWALAGRSLPLLKLYTVVQANPVDDCSQDDRGSAQTFTDHGMILQ